MMKYDFHTIKSILNLLSDECNLIYNPYFHTIKSILNGFGWC